MKLYKDDKIFNPETGRYVKKSGAVGRRLERMSVDEYNALGEGAGAGAGAGASTEEGGVKSFSEDKTKILNPSSNRFVSVSGATGRKLLRMSNDDYEKLKGGAPAPKKKPAPKKPVKKRSEALQQVIREQQAGTIVRGVQRAEQLRDEARERVQEVVKNNPVIAEIPKGHTIKDVARALVSDNRNLMLTLERAVTEEIPYQPELERQDTEPIMPVPLERQDTELEQYQGPSQEGANYLDILLNVAGVLDEITEKLEQEEEEEVIEDIVSNLVEDSIKLERARELTRLTREYLKEQDFIEEVWNEQEYDLYALEPVEDDTPEYRDAWNEAVDKLNELAEEEFGVEESKEEAKEEAKEHIFDDLTTAMGMDNMGNEAKEEGQVFDELTTEMGMQNMGNEEAKRERTPEGYIENLRRNLRNLEFLNSGRGAYMSTNSVPDPHMDAFDHIAQSKK